MTLRSQRVHTVRPQSTANLLPVQGGESDEKEVEDDKAEGGLTEEDADESETRDQWSELQSKVEEMQKKVAEHFEDTNDRQVEGPPVIKQPGQPTKEQWTQHQATHTPYEAWCPHCVSARAVRRNHPSKKSRAHVVPDTDATNEGPVTISMDNVYLHDRVAKYKESRWNPPYLVVVEHRHGRIWAYQTPSKGPNEDVSWPPARLI